MVGLLAAFNASFWLRPGFTGKGFFAVNQIQLTYKIAKKTILLYLTVFFIFGKNLNPVDFSGCICLTIFNW